MPNLSIDQIKKISHLKSWFSDEMAKLVQHETNIMQEYDQKKLALLKQQFTNENSQKK